MIEGIEAKDNEGGKVKFDLTNGTFLIGESTEDSLIYFDGTNKMFRYMFNDAFGKEEEE